MDQKRILTSEVVELIEQILKKQERVVILIAGGTASGKTTLAKELVKIFSSMAVLLSMDNYYKGRRYAEENNLNFDEPESIDMDLLIENVRDLRAGKNVNMPSYSFVEDGGKRIGYNEVISARIIIIEGLFALREELIPLGDIKIFVSVDSHGRCIRRIMRDVNRTCWSPGQILNYFFKTVEPMHAIYIDSQEANADIVIKNPHDPINEPQLANCVLEVQTKVALSEVPSEIILKKAGAEIIDRSSYEDFYFMIPRSNGHDEEIVRVRRQGNLLIFTYKSPQIAEGEVRKKNKFEFFISEGTKKQIIEVLKTQKRIYIARDIYKLNGIIFSIDRILLKDKKEYFLEVRNAEGEELELFLKKLELENAPRTNKSYYELF